MDGDDPRTPLLGDARPGRVRSVAARLCSAESWRRRLPISIWLPKYTCECFIRDAIAEIPISTECEAIRHSTSSSPEATPAQATLWSKLEHAGAGMELILWLVKVGITVGLTSIPQGIAYAILAGLPPQVGLYSSIFPGLVYALFGSCKDVTVGPTAILAALLAKYVAKSADFAYLASFLSGCVIFLLGVMQLGPLLDFISKPVISAFTTAAALQIGASQLKPLFRIQGSSGGTFVEAVVNFCRNISTVQLWDTLLGVSSIVLLLLLKHASVRASASASRARVCISDACTHVVRARNALVVFAAALLAYCLSIYGVTPFALTGKIEGGLPEFGPPPFSTVVGNQTLSFGDMLAEFGPQGLVMPLVAILESIAIAKAFAGSRAVDSTQEMVAIGLCNVVSSCCQSMPATGSFTRTALNHASGVMTPAGSLYKASLVLCGAWLLPGSLAYIPRAALAAVIMLAMYYIIDLNIVRTLYRNSKVELCVWCMSVVCGAGAGLEYGILCGLAADVLRALAPAARPSLHTTTFKVGNIDCVSLTFLGALQYAAASRVQSLLHTTTATLVVLDGKYVGHVDLGVAENIITVIRDIETSPSRRVLLWNFKEQHRALFQDIDPEMGGKFVHGHSVDQHILGMEPTRL